MLENRMPRIRLGARALPLALLVSAALASAASPARAQQFGLTGVSTSGSGCPNGSTDTLIIGATATVTFSVNSVSRATSGIDTAACTVTFTVEVPPGLTRVSGQVNWSGAVALTPDSSASFTRSLSYNGSGPVVRSTSLRPESPAMLQVSDTFSGLSLAGCDGGTDEMRLGTLLAMRGTGSVDLTSFTVVLTPQTTAPRFCD